MIRLHLTVKYLKCNLRCQTEKIMTRKINLMFILIQRHFRMNRVKSSKVVVKMIYKK